MIRIENLCKSFDFPVLSGINLTIHDGEFLVILGRSGVGKSVLIKCIVGLIIPDKGRIVVDGIELTSYRKNEILKIRKKSGFIFQSSALFDSLTVFENLSLPLIEHNRSSKDECLKRVKKSLNMVGLENVDKLYPAQLSGGMKKRVAIARAIIHEPKYVFLDEPTTGLDPQTSHKITELLRELWEKTGSTFIAVTHDFQFTEKTATRIVWLHNKKIAFEGTVKEFKRLNIEEIKAYFSKEI